MIFLRGRWRRCFPVGGSVRVLGGRCGLGVAVRPAPHVARAVGDRRRGVGGEARAGVQERARTPGGPPAPPPARSPPTSVSKKYRSASSFSFAPFPRTADVRSKASRIPPSFSLATQGRMRVTSPFSRAFFARMTTGPSIVSQWARALSAEIQAKRMIDAAPPPDLAILLMSPSFPAWFSKGLSVDPDAAIFARRHPPGIDPCQHIDYPKTTSPSTPLPDNGHDIVLRNLRVVNRSVMRPMARRAAIWGHSVTGPAPFRKTPPRMTRKK